MYFMPHFLGHNYHVAVGVAILRAVRSQKLGSTYLFWYHLRRSLHLLQPKTAPTAPGGGLQKVAASKVADALLSARYRQGHQCSIAGTDMNFTL